MANGSTAYKYTIPLDRSGGGDNPVYDIPSNGNTLLAHYQATQLVVVKTEAAPHFHKDSVNVGVEEVDPEQY